MAVKPLKINTTNIKSPFGSGGSIPSISAGTKFNLKAVESLKPVTIDSPTLEMELADDMEVVKKDISGINNSVNSHGKRINMLSGAVSTLNEQLEETTAVIKDIGNALALDFANRITEQKKDNKALKSQKDSLKKERAESKLEGSKKIGKGGGIGSKLGGVAKAGTGINFGGILDAAKILGVGIAINALWPKIGDIFTWTMNNLDKVLLVGGAILALNVVGGIGTLLSIGALLTNPWVLGILGIAASGFIFDNIAKNISNWFKSNPDKDFVGDAIPGSPENAKPGEWFKDKDGTIWVKQNFDSSNGGWSKFNKGWFGRKTPKGKEIQPQKMHDGGIVGGPTPEVLTLLQRGEGVIDADTMAALSQKPKGINLIEMDLPPIKIPPKEKKAPLGETTEVNYISSINSTNPYMIKTPKLHGILV